MSTRKKKVLISGAAGFLGSHLCDRFIKEGYDGVKTKDTTAIFNPKALQTKSQLTDIYNQAHGKIKK